MPADDMLQDALRDALNHLYDPERLRASSLLRSLGLSTTLQPAARLQELLLDAIHAMQPPPSEPAASVRRRIYSILRLRYEQQFGQKEVAAQLGLSVRQYRRLQQTALQSLALQISAQLDLTPILTAPMVDKRSYTPEELPAALQWIDKLPRNESARPDQVLEDVLRLVAPLAQQQGKMLSILQATTASCAVHPMVLRQALVNLLNTAILHDASDELVVKIDADVRQVRLTICSPDADASASLSTALRISELIIAQTMIRHFGGEVSAASGAPASGFVAELRCPSAILAPLMVVDDHVDTHDLLRRYLADTPYAMMTVDNPQQVLALAALHQPCAILLDVMMPEMDGWEVLIQLRQDERTAHLPVLVCTVLDQSELAMSLGASSFLHKPFTRPALLAALDAHRSSPAPKP